MIELQRGAASSWCAERAAWAAPGAVQLEFEPLFALRETLERGPGWRQAQGRRERHGLRSFSVSGRVRSLALQLAPAGISLRELVEEQCDGMEDGHSLYAWLPGGACGGILPALLADLPLDADTLQAYGGSLGGAGIVVLSQQDKARMLPGEHALLRRGQLRPACALRRRRDAGRPGDGGAALGRALLQKLQQELAGNPDCALARAAATSLRCMHQHFPAETV